MELYDAIAPVEMALAKQADRLRSPFGGTMELTPLCNMNCKMCFIRQNPAEMAKKGSMLSCDEWLAIAEQMKAAGVLCILVTGGEPLVYPEFKRLYTALTDMGFVITINTNGTLIDEEMADFFAARPCRRLNITLYGRDDESYGKICGNPKGHTQLVRALDLLRERNIPHHLNFSAIPDNIDFLPDACRFAKERDLGLSSVSYMFPPVRRENEAFERLSAEEAAKARVDFARHFRGEEDFLFEAEYKLRTIVPHRAIPGEEGAILCRAGRSGFWIDWTGHLLPCGMFTSPKYDLRQMTFLEAWKEVVSAMEQMRMYTGCSECEKKAVCSVCAAACFCESGDMSKKPEYVCRLTDAYVNLLKQYSSPSK